jgi:hypothetical protein
LTIAGRCRSKKEREREREKKVDAPSLSTSECLRIAWRLRNYEARAAARKSYNFLIKYLAAEWKRSEAVIERERERDGEGNADGGGNRESGARSRER